MAPAKASQRKEPLSVDSNGELENLTPVQKAARTQAKNKQLHKVTAEATCSASQSVGGNTSTQANGSTRGRCELLLLCHDVQRLTVACGYPSNEVSKIQGIRAMRYLTVVSHSLHHANITNMLVWQVDTNTQSRKQQLSAEPDSGVEQIQLKKVKTGMALTVSIWRGP